MELWTLIVAFGSLHHLDIRSISWSSTRIMTTLKVPSQLQSWLTAKPTNLSINASKVLITDQR
ncbi:hypothetical protein HYE67_002779 [Fusarium culmorum]|uniref:Uncharacterized protein n=1 Tax=Fusarium culmorum TaxID=5516 RepID=A0A2T4GSX7_FUSCU|nr:hypothetical protein FCULG_00007029 [Fusarium culmorum]QPC60548.1 hypothetical protein HYE67_002779 [Fusarium culmorum]